MPEAFRPGGQSNILYLKADAKRAFPHGLMLGKPERAGWNAFGNSAVASLVQVAHMYVYVYIYIHIYIYVYSIIYLFLYSLPFCLPYMISFGLSLFLSLCIDLCIIYYFICLCTWLFISQDPSGHWQEGYILEASLYIAYRHPAIGPALPLLVLK